MRILKNTLKNTLKIEKKQESENNKLSAILSSMREGLVMFDQRSRVILMNQAAGILLRVAPAEAIEQNIHTLFLLFQGKKRIEEKNSPIKTAIREISTIHVGLEDDIFCKSKMGKLFPLTMTVTGLHKYGNIKGVIIFNDITREKEIDRMKTEFVSVVSHQLRTPLAAIKLFAEMLNEEKIGKLNPSQRDYVENVQKSTTRMIELVNELLNVSRMESGKLRIKIESVVLEDFIQSIIEEVNLLAKTKKCSIIFHAPQEKRASTLMDPNLLRQVIRNLIVNAIRYSTPENCRVEVKLTQKDEEYIISVKDYGIGIPRDIQSRIFERFFRADNAQRVETGGIGLGLYVARMLIETSGGRIWFESPGINKGATFYVTLPKEGMRGNGKKRGIAGT